MKKLQSFHLLIAALTIPILLLGIGRVYAGDRAGPRSIAPDSIKFHQIWEKEFPKEIKDVAWGETGDGRLYPKIIVFEDEVRFYDGDFSLIATYPYPKYSSIMFAKNGNYLGIQTIERGCTKEKPGQTRITVFTDRGEKIWERKGKIEFDIPLPTLYISSKDGSAAEAHRGDPAITFRDSVGRMIRHIDLFKNDEWDITRGAICSFSENGEYFVAIVDEKVPIPLGIEGIQPRSGNPYVMLFTKEGKELWRYPLGEQGLGLHVSISPTGQFVVAASRPGVYLLTKKGNLKSTYSLGVTSGIWAPYSFSPDEEHVILSDLHKVLFVRTFTGEVLWRHIFRADETIRGVCFSRNNIGIMLEVESENCPSVISIFNQEGKLIVKRCFSENIFPFDYFRRAKAGISSDGKEICIISKRRALCWQSE